MKILYLITKSEAGGAQSHVYELCKYFGRQNEIGVVSYPGGWLEDKCEELGVKFTDNKYFSNRLNPFSVLKAKKQVTKTIQDFQPDIVFIDSLTSISSAFSGESNRFRVYMEQLFRYLEVHEITSFLIMETPHPTHLGAVVGGVDQAVSFLSDGIIVIYNVLYGDGKRGRAVEVLKMRGEDIDRKMVEMEIKDKQGIVIYPNKQIKGKYTLT